MSQMNIPPDVYGQIQKDFKNVKKMSLNSFLTWVRSIHSTAYDEGWNDAIDKFMNARGRVNINNEIDAVVVDDYELYNTILSVKGIGRNRANEVVRKLTGGMDEKDDTE